MKVTFCPLASGSNGNSIYIGAGDTHILIDAGLSGIRIEKALHSLHITGDMLDGIFVTHEHSDHIQGVGILSRRYDLPIFATPKTWQRIDRHGMLGKLKPENKRTIFKNQHCQIKDLAVLPFEIPHDAAEPVGYTVFTPKHKISVATDIGQATDIIKQNIADSHVLLLESNHDLEMLQNGRYPLELKRRIMGSKGHLSNDNAGLLLTEIMSGTFKHIYLGHLSEENNRPLIAMDTVMTILEAHGIPMGRECRLTMAERGFVSEAVTLE